MNTQKEESFKEGIQNYDQKSSCRLDISATWNSLHSIINICSFQNHPEYKEFQAGSFLSLLQGYFFPRENRFFMAEFSKFLDEDFMKYYSTI